MNTSVAFRRQYFISAPNAWAKDDVDTQSHSTFPNMGNNSYNRDNKYQERNT